jgi:hypothetical protein
MLELQPYSLHLGSPLRYNSHVNISPCLTPFFNSQGCELLGRSIYKSVADMPDPVDLAAVLISSGFVPDALLAGVIGARFPRAG